MHVRPWSTVESALRASDDGVPDAENARRHHGPGRKHDRRIVLEPWQRSLVEQHPADFLRGLFHSDGARVRNWASRRVAATGEVRRHDYARWQFTNRSEDILGLCGWALDLVEVPWRRSSPTTMSVSRRAAVARLDTLIGVKR